MTEEEFRAAFLHGHSSSAANQSAGGKMFAV
jgi:hypothetical protein